MQAIASYLLFLLTLTKEGLLIIVVGALAIMLYAGASFGVVTLSSPWWNHDFLSDDICIGDSGDFGDGWVVTKKKKSLVHAQPLQSDQAAKEAQEQTGTVDFSVLVAYQIPTGCGRSSSD